MKKYKIVEFNDGDIVLYEQKSSSENPWVKIDVFESFSAARKWIALSVDIGKRRVIKRELVVVE